MEITSGLILFKYSLIRISRSGPEVFIRKMVSASAPPFLSRLRNLFSAWKPLISSGTGL